MTDEAVVADRLALRDLVERYARCADRREAAGFAECFTPDGVLATPRGEVRGREDLLDVVPRLARYRATVHLVANHLVEVHGDEATGEVLGVARHLYDDAGTERVHVMHIRYEDRYRRTAAGWRIVERNLVLVFEEDHPLRT